MIDTERLPVAAMRLIAVRRLRAVGVAARGAWYRLR